MSAGFDSTLPADRRERLERLQWRALVVGAVALAVCVVGAFFSPTQFFRAYLVAYLFFLGLAHGCFAILMIYHLTGGAWGFLIRRVLEAGMRTLPLMAVLFIPIACGVEFLYDWADPSLVAASRALQHKQVYLNVPFFIGRAVLYFVLWVGIAFLLSRWSREQDRTGDPALARRLTSLSGPGLAVYGVTITFASVDWVMSLQPAFRSTIFGPLFASGELLTGFACALVVMAWLVARPPLARLVSVEALNDLGNLLFTFLIIWAYMEFFQFMLIWIANLPYDVIWYLPRSTEGWQWVVWAIGIFHFAVPFFLLLSRDVKREPRALAALAGLILFMHLIYLYYQVLPAFPDTTLAEHWMDVLAPFAVGGLWLANFAWDLKSGPVLPQHDPSEQAAIHYRALDQEEAARAAEEVHHG
jgi:hypothetical protein